MVKALFDTNILIDFLEGTEQSRDEIERYAERAISTITWMEVMVGAPAEEEHEVRDFLKGFTLIRLDQDIAERAVVLRRQYRMRLPDAIIWASADVHAMLFVTRNTKDFPRHLPGIRVPYS